MKISLDEKSKYYKGLLILVGRDRVIDRRERELMLEIGRILDFDERFCNTAMNDLPRNVHIKSAPPVFSQGRLAECFLHDAILLAVVDGRIHPHELAWLNKVARANSLPDDWVDNAVRQAVEESRTGQPQLHIRRVCDSSAMSSEPSRSDSCRS